MTPEAWITAYEGALATQDWRRVGPLLHPDVCVTFSDGRRFCGRAAVGEAYERNFRLIRDETYTISDIVWVKRENDFAAYLFSFTWSGLIGGKPASGSGRGTAVLVREGEEWRLLVEQLGPAPRDTSAA